MADWTDYANWIMQMYGAYNNSKDPKFSKVPEDPALTALRAKLLGFIDNSPTRNALGSMVGAGITNASQSHFQLPQGYKGYQAYSSPGPKYDLSKILPNIFGATDKNPSVGGASMPSPNPYAGGGVGGGSGGAPGNGSNTGGISPDEDPNMRLPTVIADPGGNSPGALIGSPQPFDPNMTGRDGNNPNIKPGPYGTPGGGGIDIKGIQNAWNNVPASVKMGGLGAVVAFIAAGLGLSPVIVGAVLKGIPMVRDWYNQHNKQPQGTTPPPGYNPTNPSNPWGIT